MYKPREIANNLDSNTKFCLNDSWAELIDPVTTGDGLEADNLGEIVFIDDCANIEDFSGLEDSNCDIDGKEDTSGNEFQTTKSSAAEKSQILS